MVEQDTHNVEVGGSWPSGSTKLGLVVQLVRMSACHAEGREFESRLVRKKFFEKCIQVLEYNGSIVSNK